MEIIRLVIFIAFISLASGKIWQYSNLVQDNQDGGNCPGAKCPTMVRPKPNCFAQKAAKAAKEASDAQIEAGAAAARQVQKQLAEKAGYAAKAAEAAYVGKQQLVEQIESELSEGRLVVQKEKSRVLSIKAYADIARQAVCQASEEVRGLIDILKKAKEGVVHSERVVAGSRHAVNEQKEAVNEARCRLELLLHQVEVARSDFMSTKAAAERAASAAQEARKRAGRQQCSSGTASLIPNFEQTFYKD